MLFYPTLRSAADSGGDTRRAETSGGRAGIRKTESPRTNETTA